MAGETPKLATDANGIVQTGRFAGHHIDDVFAYVEHLETAVGGDPQPAQPAAPAPPEPKAADPAATLAAKAGNRVDSIQQLALATAARQEQDDEESFAATVPDYETFRPEIAKMKERMPPAARTQRGFHREAYLFLKMKDPNIQARILERSPESVENVPPEEGAPAPEPEPAPPTPPVAPPVKITPKPVPAPSAAPSPGSRSTPAPAPKRAKLTATPKIERIAASLGKGIDVYLLELEAQGVTQDMLDSQMAGVGPVNRRRSVYDAS